MNDNDSNKINPNNEQTKKKLKKIGIVLTVIGSICTIVGFVDFFSAMGSFGGMPNLFFLFFIGFPCLGIGISFLRFAYIGKVARYTAGETAPVAKDTINYIFEDTKEDKEIKEKDIKKEKKCPYCYEKNDIDAVFCDNCGKQLIKKCSECDTENDADAKYCKKCGKKVC